MGNLDFLAEQLNFGRAFALPIFLFEKKKNIIEQMQYSYKIIYSLNQDAWNWWDSCNCVDFGVDWKAKIDPKIARKLSSKTKKEAFAFLIPYLKKKYEQEKNFFNQKEEFIKKEFSQKLEIGCEKIAQVMGRPLYRSHFQFYLTTFERAPYDEIKGIIFLPIYCKNPMAIFLHELCHFQFIHCWRKNPKSGVSRLSQEQFEFLKESLTVILDKDFLPIIKKPDKGYEIHKDFRRELSQFWKKEKEFDKLVDFGTQKLACYSNR